MNQTPNRPNGDAASTSYQKLPRKEYDVPDSRPKAFMVEDSQWKRIRVRVQKVEAQGDVDWLIAIATAIGGIAASAALALLALPKATKNSEELASFVKPTLWAVLIAGAIVAGAMIVLWVAFRRGKTKTAADICNEMDTIREAWLEREKADVDAPEGAT